MLKRLLCLALCVLLVLPMAVLATEETDSQETTPDEIPAVQLSIGSAEEFLTFTENCRLDRYSKNLFVTLTADIDLTGTVFEGVPIFCGSFDGGGHTIRYNLTAEGSALGLFRYLTDDAIVQDLDIQADIHPSGSRCSIGTVAGENAGIIRRCSFTGTVQGSDSVGGIAGINTVTGIIDGCSTGGDIHGNHFVGGTAGKNQGVIRNCENQATINTTPQQNTVELSDITIESITASESANTTTDIGGIAGLSAGVIRRCTNRADVGYRQMGYNVGGIAGTQSGYIVDCENYGNINGRKEVGGIAGQMEPAAKIEYSMDTLQILEQQLDTMSGLTAQASANAQNSASSIAGQVANIQDQVANAQDAIDQLLPEADPIDPENPELPEVTLPDEDSLLAAQNALSSSMSGMQSSLNDITSTAQGAAYSLSRDMKAITNQVEAMSQTISAAEQSLGGSATDVSDADTDADTSGKVAYCKNHGPVHADMNAGGITGAISPENDLDIQDDLDILGEASLNFESELRAVILSCDNDAQVEVNKQNCGGIAGLMTMGLVKKCQNSGPVSGENADYLGGIAGMSEGFIRACSAKCTVDGKAYVGGIAGSGKTVSDCRAMNRLTGSEKLGALLGFAESRQEIASNYYVPTQEDIGAIDSISYDGCGQSIDEDAFLALADLPAMFRKVTVSFRYDDGLKTVTLPLGGSLSPEDIPELPEKAGHTVQWENLEEGPLLFDCTVQAIYTPYESVIAFNFINDESRPVLLAQGSFTPKDTLSMTELDRQPTVQSSQVFLEGRQFSVDTPQDMTLRYHPDYATADSHLYVRSNGTWTKTAFTSDGSYLVFRVDAYADAFCFVKDAPNYLLYGTIALVLLGAVITLVTVICKKWKKG